MSHCLRFVSTRPMGRRSFARRLMVWGLMLALVVYGYTGVLIDVLGPMHHHVDTPVSTASAGPKADLGPAMPGLTRVLDTVRHWHASAQAQRQVLTAHGREVHPHRHGLFERHHHEAGDASVVALDGQGSSSHGADDTYAAAASSSATLPLGLSPVLTVPAPAAGRFPWPSAATQAWRSADLPQLERPPQV